MKSYFPYVRYGKHDKSNSDITIYNSAGIITGTISVKKFKKSTSRVYSDKKQTEKESARYVEWANAVKQRDHRRCVLCGSKEWPNAHHIERWADNKQRRYDLRNGVTLCVPCHEKHHGYQHRQFPRNITAKLIGYIETSYNKR